LNNNFKNQAKKTNKNFYTQEILPEFVKIQIKARQKIAQKYNLPKSQTLIDLLTALENGEDKEKGEENDEENREDEENNRARVIRIMNRETGEENIVTTPFRNFDINTDTEDEILEEFFSQEGYDYLGRAECFCPECERIQNEEDLDDLDELDDLEEDELEDTNTDTEIID
jgi:hypothetical protein